MENQEKPIDLSFRSTPSSPLLGLTILLVEDSRFACEAMRIMALRSGARLRRADCLTSARRHMRLYRPSVVIVDIGLPDGSGLDLIREISGNHPRVPAIIGTSGDDMMHVAAVKAGADAFFAKPYDSIGAARFRRVSR
jgi:DNA-binding response OmpR family regulator